MITFTSKKGDVTLVIGGDMIQGDKVGGGVVNISSDKPVTIVQRPSPNQPPTTEPKGDDFVMGKIFHGDQFNATKIVIHTSGNED